MAQRRKSVRKIKETIRLHEAGFNNKQIEKLVSVSRKTVRKHIERAGLAGLSYAEVEKMYSKQLYTALFPVKPEDEQRIKPQPDWQRVYADMKKKGMTLMRLWEEYIDIYPDGTGTASFVFITVGGARNWI